MFQRNEEIIKLRKMYQLYYNVIKFTFFIGYLSAALIKLRSLTDEDIKN